MGVVGLDHSIRSPTNEEFLGDRLQDHSIRSPNNEELFGDRLQDHNIRSPNNEEFPGDSPHAFITLDHSSLLNEDEEDEEVEGDDRMSLLSHPSHPDKPTPREFIGTVGVCGCSLRGIILSVFLIGLAVGTLVAITLRLADTGADTSVSDKFKFASYYADHMVLQRGPKRAIVWGMASTIGSEVTVKVSGQTEVKAKVVDDPAGGEGIWKAKLPAVTEAGPFTITATSTEGEITLNDVLFGDVWVCSGQSNMAFPMSKVINSTEEITDALAFLTIRIMKTSRVQSSAPLEDLRSIATQWTEPTKGTVASFSAVCMLFGEYLQPHRNYPLGLVESAWGGTSIESWSSPEVIAKCSGTLKRFSGVPSMLWNAMMNPFTDMTITGVLWYQGESNAARADLYSCQFPAMITDWREKFHARSLQETESDFPFGFVQLATNIEGTDVGTFPALRWSQTADVGFVPNEKMQRTFMAVAMDLPDYHSPTTHTMHPRYKQDVAARLVLGARTVAYNDTVSFQGPFPETFSLNNVATTLTINYGQDNPVTVLNNNGFEICCSSTSSTVCTESDEWVAAPITGQDTSSVTVSATSCESRAVVGLRYEWRTSPCALKKCAIYGTNTDLPAPPYITTSGFS